MSGTGTAIRLGKIFREGGTAALVDFSRQALSDRPENIERCKDYLLNNTVDGVVLAPARLEAMHRSLLGRTAPRIFLRLNWFPGIGCMEDAGGGADSEFRRLIDIPGLAKTGADGGVSVFPLGFSEELEYCGFKEITGTSHEARRAGMPLLVDTHFGREITDKNRLEAAELAVMMSTEAGADGVLVPCSDEQENLWEKLRYAQIPVFLKITAQAAPNAQFPRVLRTVSWDAGSQDGGRQ